MALVTPRRSSGSARQWRAVGYSDIEVALLTEAGLIGPSTVIATTVHPLQVIDGPLPDRA
jgi:5-formyltetrahydrofolate cyclo-ligase